jgi:hypothetical protein
MKQKSLTIFLLVLVVLASMWATGKLQKILAAGFGKL